MARGSPAWRSSRRSGVPASQVNGNCFFFRKKRLLFFALLMGPPCFRTKVAQPRPSGKNDERIEPGRDQHGPSHSPGADERAEQPDATVRQHPGRVARPPPSWWRRQRVRSGDVGQQPGGKHGAERVVAGRVDLSDASASIFKKEPKRFYRGCRRVFTKVRSIGTALDAVPRSGFIATCVACGYSRASRPPSPDNVRLARGLSRQAFAHQTRVCVDADARDVDAQFLKLTRISPQPRATGTKVFWFFFSKKNCLPSLSLSREQAA